MSNLKERHLFPGNNSCRGFYSFYRYIISQEDAQRIFCIKGGPGTGKSSLMKKLGNLYLNKGYTVEFHHCSSDPNSLDGILIKELNIALVDGTSPHIVDPINPGAVDEVLNMGDALDMDMLAKYKKEVMSVNKEVGKNFKRAYRFLGAAKSIHDDWSSLNGDALDQNKILNLIENLKNNIFKVDRAGYGSERHLFASAITPDGIISYGKELTNDFKTKYVLIGGPGLSKTSILKSIGACGQRKGYFIEYMHDPFIPERIEHLFIPEINTCILTNNEISMHNFSGIDYNLIDYCNSYTLKSKINEVDADSKLFYELINKGISFINKAHQLHDDMEDYYIKAMNFDVANAIYDTVVKRIEKYEQK